VNEASRPNDEGPEGPGSSGTTPAAVLTVSDGVHDGTREDASGDLLAALLEEEGFEVERLVVPDERDAIEAALAALAERARVVLTTGGTGFAPRDVTPEATAAMIDRSAPGIAEAIRADALVRTPHALLARGLAGLRGTTLVVNLPGSPGGCRDGFTVLRPALRHGLALAAGERDTAHRQT
jgi:molybdopterin adenylyltransferase